jgi:hypothetical protein
MTKELPPGPDPISTEIIAVESNSPAVVERTTSQPLATTLDDHIAALITGGTSAARTVLAKQLLQQLDAATAELASVRAKLESESSIKADTRVEMAVLRNDLKHLKHTNRDNEVVAYLATALATAGGALMTLNNLFGILIAAGLVLLFKTTKKRQDQEKEGADRGDT